MLLRRPVVLALVLACQACGDASRPSDPPGADPETYAVALDRCRSSLRSAGVTETRCTLLVTRSAGGASVGGATLRYRVSVGTLESETGTSDAGGVATAVWITTAADIKGVSSGTLAACAMNIESPTCTPTPVWTQPF